jgi:hypothetical protein
MAGSCKNGNKLQASEKVGNLTGWVTIGFSKTMLYQVDQMHHRAIKNYVCFKYPFHYLVTELYKIVINNNRLWSNSQILTIKYQKLD